MNIIKYDAEGKRVILVWKMDLVSPRCIACDNEDNIYCIDQDSNKIMTCERRGKNVRLHSVALEKNSTGRSALTIINKLYIAEVSLEGIIKVNDKKLTTIKHRNMGVNDISAGLHQNIFVSDSKNSCVHVFSKDGIYSRSFCLDKLKKPCGLCVHGQYV